MPVFDFKCNDCTSEFEKVVLTTDRDEIKCEKCLSTNIEKLVTGTSFRLKGAGWAETLYDKGVNSTDERIIKQGPVKSLEETQSRV